MLNIFNFDDLIVDTILSNFNGKQLRTLLVPLNRQYYSYIMNNKYIWKHVRTRESDQLWYFKYILTFKTVHMYEPLNSVIDLSTGNHCNYIHGTKNDINMQYVRIVACMRQLNMPQYFPELVHVFPNKTGLHIFCRRIPNAITLFDYIILPKKYGKPTSEIILQIILRICEICEAMHSKGILHRNLNLHKFEIPISDRLEFENIYLTGFMYAAGMNDICTLPINPSLVIYRAPEAFETLTPINMQCGGNYGQPLDMWAVGIIFLILKSYEFRKNLIQSSYINKLSISYESIIMSQVDKCRKNLTQKETIIVNALLTDVKSRLSARELLKILNSNFIAPPIIYDVPFIKLPLTDIHTMFIKYHNEQIHTDIFYPEKYYSFAAYMLNKYFVSKKCPTCITKIDFYTLISLWQTCCRLAYNLCNFMVIRETNEESDMQFLKVIDFDVFGEKHAVLDCYNRLFCLTSS